MDGKFLTIKEASDLSGKSPITIRRMIKYLITQKDKLTTQETTQKHNLSSQMISQMISQERQNDNPLSPFIYKMNEDLIRRVFNLTTQPPTQMATQDKPDDYSNNKKEDTQMSSQKPAFNEVVTLLKEQVKTKDEQIKDLGGKIDQLIERSRETNILMKGLQERVFQLEAPRETKVEDNDRTVEKQQEGADEPETTQNRTEKQPEGKESHLEGDTTEEATKKKERKWWDFLGVDN